MAQASARRGHKVTGAGISVLMPSRDRPGSLVSSALSLLRNAERPDLVEILVAADPDDQVTADTARDMNLPCWIAPERYGYSRLNVYFNALCELSGKRWVLLWNDDARMLTGGWDRIITQSEVVDGRQIAVCDLWVDRHSPDLCTFPAVRRDAIEATGGVFSPHTCHCDTWWQDIGRATESIAPVPIKVEHQRADLTGQHNDRTYREGQAGYRSHEFYGAVVQGHMHSAITNLRRHLRAAQS